MMARPSVLFPLIGARFDKKSEGRAHSYAIAQREKSPDARTRHDTTRIVPAISNHEEHSHEPFFGEETRNSRYRTTNGPVATNEMGKKTGNIKK